MYEITLPVTREVFWLLATLAGIIAFSFVIYAALPRQEGGDDGLNIKEVLGAKKLSDPLFALLVILWIVLAMCLFGGLVATIGKIAQLVIVGVETVEGKEARFPLIQLAALTATLGATVALPFTVIRLKLTQQQTETATAALFNEKITQAAADLHAQRQVTKDFDGKRATVWEDDIVRRNAAIDRLEGLVREEAQEATRVSRLLSVYLRELSKEHRTPQDWIQNSEIQRSDMQNAMQVLGRLATIERVDEVSLEVDLRHTNLRNMDLSELHFERGDFRNAALQRANLNGAKLMSATLDGAQLREAHLNGVKLQKAHLSGADLRKANFWYAELQGTEFWGAKMHGADLWGAKLHEAKLCAVNLQEALLGFAELQGADLKAAKLQGADLMRAKLDVSTNLKGASLTGASVRGVDFTDIPQIADHIGDVFGDHTTKLPKDVVRPKTWPHDEQNDEDYIAQWLAFAASKGIEIPGDPLE